MISKFYRDESSIIIRKNGSVMAEFIVIVLFVPVNNGMSLSATLVDAVKRAHAAYIYVASMPRLPGMSDFLSKNKKKHK